MRGVVRAGLIAVAAIVVVGGYRCSRPSCRMATWTRALCTRPSWAPRERLPRERADRVAAAGPRDRSAMAVLGPRRRRERRGRATATASRTTARAGTDRRRLGSAAADQRLRAPAGLRPGRSAAAAAAASGGDKKASAGASGPGAGGVLRSPRRLLRAATRMCRGSPRGWRFTSRRCRRDARQAALLATAATQEEIYSWLGRLDSKLEDELIRVGAGPSCEAPRGRALGVERGPRRRRADHGRPAPGRRASDGGLRSARCLRGRGPGLLVRKRKQSIGSQVPTARASKASCPMTQECAGLQPPGNYSHSIVPGGFDVMSSTTRFTCGSR